MDRSTLPVIVIVALVAGAAGWFLHTPPTIDKAAEVADAAKAPPVNVPATAPSSGKVAAPTAAPAPVTKMTDNAPATRPTPASTAPAVATTSAEPAAPGTTPPELTNVITEMTTLLQSGDLLSLYENYAPPQKMAALTPEQKTFLENQLRDLQQGPNGAKMLQGQMELVQALNGLTPTMNSAGDHATYQVPTPKDLAPAGTPLPPTIPVNFVKIDGRWYLDQ